MNFTPKELALIEEGLRRWEWALRAMNSVAGKDLLYEQQRDNERLYDEVNALYYKLRTTK